METPKSEVEELKWKIVGDKIGHEHLTKNIIEMYAEAYGYHRHPPKQGECNKCKELECVLDAWHTAFGTTQLTHALDRLQVAESKQVEVSDKNVELIALDKQKVGEAITEGVKNIFVAIGVNCPYCKKSSGLKGMDIWLDTTALGYIVDAVHAKFAQPTIQVKFPEVNSCPLCDRGKLNFNKSTFEQYQPSNYTCDNCKKEFSPREFAIRADTIDEFKRINKGE